MHKEKEETKFSCTLEGDISEISGSHGCDYEDATFWDVVSL
jgi:hypothetical protein